MVWMTQDVKHDQGHAKLDSALEGTHEAGCQFTGPSQGVFDRVIRHGGDSLTDLQFPHSSGNELVAAVGRQLGLGSIGGDVPCK